MSRVPPPLSRRSSTVSEFLRRKSFIGNSDEVKEMKDLFKMCDSNSDGVVSKKELLVMMRSMGLEPTKSEFNLLWEQLDKNKDGELTFEEFMSGMNWLKKGVALAEEIGGEDDEEAAEADSAAPTGAKKVLEDKVEVLSKYVQLVIETGVKKAKVLLAADNKSGAQAILDMLDVAVVMEMERALGEKLLSKETKATYEEVLKGLKK